MKEEYITITIEKEPKIFIRRQLFYIKVLFLNILLSPIIRIKYWYEK